MQSVLSKTLFHKGSYIVNENEHLIEEILKYINFTKDLEISKIRQNNTQNQHIQ